MSACECKCDPDCAETERKFFPEVTTPIIDIPWFIAKDNSFWLGKHFQDETTPVPAANPVETRDCGDYYCPGDAIRTATGDFLSIRQNFFGKCAKSPLIAGKISEGILCANPAEIKIGFKSILKLYENIIPVLILGWSTIWGWGL